LSNRGPIFGTASRFAAAFRAEVPPFDAGKNARRRAKRKKPETGLVSGFLMQV
jgi:hypothetical protein